MLFFNLNVVFIWIYVSYALIVISKFYYYIASRVLTTYIAIVSVWKRAAYDLYWRIKKRAAVESLYGEDG